MSQIITFTIPGEPRGKGRPRFFRGPNFVRTYTDADTVSYENLVKTMFLQAAAKSGWVKPGRDVPLKMEIYCWKTQPASWSNKKSLATFWSVTKPDLDNVAKIISDALNKIAYDDDNQIAVMSIQKAYDMESQTVVTIRELKQL